MAVPQLAAAPVLACLLISAERCCRYGFGDESSLRATTTTVVTRCICRRNRTGNCETTYVTCLRLGASGSYVFRRCFYRLAVGVATAEPPIILRAVAYRNVNGPSLVFCQHSAALQVLPVGASDRHGPKRPAAGRCSCSLSETGHRRLTAVGRQQSPASTNR